MKKVFFFIQAAIFFLLLVACLTSCTTFHDAPTVSVWSGGNFIGFWLPFLVSFIYLYQSYKASKSNSTTDNNNGTISDNTGNVPIYKLGKFYFFVVLQLAAWLAVWYFNSGHHR